MDRNQSDKMTENYNEIKLSDVYLKKKNTPFIALSEDLMLYVGQIDDVENTLTIDKEIAQKGDPDGITFTCNIIDKETDEPITGIPIYFYSDRILYKRQITLTTNKAITQKGDTDGITVTCTLIDKDTNEPIVDAPVYLYNKI